MKKFLKLTGSFVGAFIVAGGTSYIQNGNPIHAVIAGVIGGITGSGLHAIKSPLQQSFDPETNKITVGPEVKIDPKG